MGVEINRMERKDSVSGTAEGKFEFTREGGADDENEASSRGSGVYLGILNLFTTFPQMISTFISTIVFYVFDSAEGQRGADADTPAAIGVCLFIGALSSFGAAYATQQFRRLE